MFNKKPGAREQSTKYKMSDDLYDDLEDTKVAPPAPSRKSGASNRPTSFAEEVQVLQERVAALEIEKETLKRNMGTLYRTAIAELKRKDAEITRFQEELEAKDRQR